MTFFSQMELYLAPFTEFLDTKICYGGGWPYVAEDESSSSDVVTKCQSKQSWRAGKGVWDSNANKCFTTKNPGSSTTCNCPSGYQFCSHRTSNCDCQNDCFRGELSFFGCGGGSFSCYSHCNFYVDKECTTTVNPGCEAGWSPCSSNSNINCGSDSCYSPSSGDYNGGCLGNSFPGTNNDCCYFETAENEGGDSDWCLGGANSLGDWCMTIRQVIELPSCVAQAIIDQMMELITTLLPTMPDFLQNFAIPGIDWPTVPTLTLPAPLAIPAIDFVNMGFECLPGGNTLAITADGLPVVSPTLDLRFEVPSLDLGIEDLECPPLSPSPPPPPPPPPSCMDTKPFKWCKRRKKRGKCSKRWVKNKCRETCEAC